MDDSEHDITHEIRLMKSESYEMGALNSSKRSPNSMTQKENSKEAPAASCPHNVGYLKTRSKDQTIPDSCLTCPKVLQCMV
jgi:hypothetical protein